MGVPLILIVDDNDRYATELEKYYKHHQISTERARTAKEGWEMFQAKKYSTVITDITMETQLSGFYLLRKIKKSGFSGILICASTAFDISISLILSKLYMPIWGGVRWLIPKIPLKRGEVIFIPTRGTHTQPDFYQ